MAEAVFLIVRYQAWVFLLISVGALVYVWSFARARQYLSRTPFGLEREVAQRRQIRALTMLSLLVTLAVSMVVMDRVVVPDLTRRREASVPATQPAPSPSPMLFESGNQPLVVDSSGCDNPNATLTTPQSHERIAGAFEVRGTANIENFAFYKFEIGGRDTGGAWIPLGVGSEPVVENVLGRFDASAHETGEYAFRLVVVDNAGNFPPPCVIAVTIVNLAPP